MMKKVLFISVLVCFTAINQLFAANPIPSYNVLVTGRAVFQESSKPIVRNSATDARRQMNIQTSTSSPTNGFSHAIVVVTIYRLDGAITKGPYYLICGQSVSAAIDDTTWGVSVLSEEPSRVSVWASLGQR
jgi:hypothetical protein